MPSQQRVVLPPWNLGPRHLIHLEGLPDTGGTRSYSRHAPVHLAWSSRQDVWKHVGGRAQFGNGDRPRESDGAAPFLVSGTHRLNGRRPATTLMSMLSPTTRRIRPRARLAPSWSRGGWIRWGADRPRSRGTTAAGETTIPSGLAASQSATCTDRAPSRGILVRRFGPASSRGLGQTIVESLNCWCASRRRFGRGPPGAGSCRHPHRGKSRAKHSAKVKAAGRLHDEADQEHYEQRQAEKPQAPAKSITSGHAH
jgi:hypothetical protein